jgi:hypothetical protein
VVVNQPVGIEKLNDSKSQGINLMNNFPNPFSESTRITFQTHEPGNVKLTILDQKGSVVEVLMNEFKTPGTYGVDFQPSGSFAKGIYYYKIQANNEYEAKPMLMQ